MSDNGDFADIVAMIGLTGSQRIILEEIGRLIDEDQSVSLMKLSLLTNYHLRTVQRSVCRLRQLGLVTMVQPRHGARADYRININTEV
jgi:Mn-dependent DtxR family transcriptional regulator